MVSSPPRCPCFGMPALWVTQGWLEWCRPHAALGCFQTKPAPSQAQRHTARVYRPTYQRGTRLRVFILFGFLEPLSGVDGFNLGWVRGVGDRSVGCTLLCNWQRWQRQKAGAWVVMCFSSVTVDGCPTEQIV
jgi:hypothetical protein